MKTTLSYIVESTLTCDLPAGDETIFDPSKLETIFRSLKYEYGFSLVVWSPETPDLVREFHWNTEEERIRDRNNVGRIVERKATEREKRDGQRQHDEDTRRARTPATESPFPHPEFGQESERTVPAALQAAVNEVEALRLMSYTGGQPDLREEDIRGIRDLLIDLTLLLAERTGEPLPEAEMIL